MNPAELAQPFAEKLVRTGQIPGSDGETFKVDRLDLLDDIARKLRILPESYMVHADRALVLPHRRAFAYESVRLEEPVFEGELAGYMTVDSPRHLGRNAINAVCLRFQNVTLFDFVNDECKGSIFVPVFPSPSMDKIAS